MEKMLGKRIFWRVYALVGVCIGWCIYILVQVLIVCVLVYLLLFVACVLVHVLVYVLIHYNVLVDACAGFVRELLRYTWCHVLVGVCIGIGWCMYRFVHALVSCCTAAYPSTLVGPCLPWRWLYNY